MKAPLPNLSNLQNAFTYLENVIRISLKNALKKSKQEPNYPQFEFIDNADPFYKFCIDCQLSFEEFILVLLALQPHIQPNLIESIVNEVLDGKSDFPEIGGKKTQDIRYMMPTGDTALFILGAYDIKKRMQVQAMLSTEGYLIRENILELENVKIGEPKMSGRIYIEEEMVDLFTKGYISMPKFSSEFPAQYISTKMTFDDLVISDAIMDQVKEIRTWVNCNGIFFKEMKMDQKVSPGYTALLHGPPGTGKTLTSTLLGKYTGRPVFRVDLSTMVSKYIGETEKNLANLFDKAEKKDWILAFDEADALFSKRTSVKSSNDKHANQEVAYLLQRIESFSGLVILTSNFKGNMDEAFIRRFNAMIEFPLPNREQRFKIWQNTFPDKIKFENDWPICDLASQYELAGGNIVNVIQHSCMNAIDKGDRIVRLEVVEMGIKREYEKMGKVFQKIENTFSVNEEMSLEEAK